jgi:hypothetical protein
MNEFSYSNLKDEWKRIDHALIPGDLLASMPQPECKGLTLLTDVMINATVCKLGPRVGLITAPYSDDIEIVLDVAETIERRLPAPWNGFWHYRERRNRNAARGLEGDRHLETWVRNSKTGANTKVCIAATGEGYVPAIDDCVSFVLWAEAGFPYPPPTLADRILFVRDPEHYEAEKARKKEALRAAQQAELLRKDLAREKSLAETKALFELELEVRRVRNLGWHELMAEHESADPPTDAISSALYHLRESLLTLPAPGHPIGQH